MSSFSTKTAEIDHKTYSDNQKTLLNPFWDYPGCLS